jgi:hypothetical protein
MSELNNPLFENEREFLERQKEEYKHALMGDVDHIKSQSQEIGKKVAMAGGVLLAGYLLRRLFSGGDKKKSKKLKGNKSKTATSAPVMAVTSDYDSIVHAQEDAYTLSSERMPHAETHPKHETGVSKSFMKSDLAQMLTQQLVALLMVYITKKVEEYLNSVSENNDIATAPLEVIDIETTEIIYPQQDAF